jgi:hypothetical protein
MANIKIDFEDFRDGCMSRFYKIDQVNWDAVMEAEDAVLNFNARSKEITDSIGGLTKTWRQKQTNLQSKYETISLWIN